jgi:hypothetical protein
MEIFKYKYDDLFNPTLKALHELGGQVNWEGQKDLCGNQSLMEMKGK